MDSPRERPSGIPRLSRLPVPRSSIPRPATATFTKPSLRPKPSRDNFGGGELNPPKSRTAVSRDHLRPSTSGSTSLNSHEAPVETVPSRHQLRPIEQRPPTAKARLQSFQSTPKKEPDVSNYHETALAHVARPEVDLAAHLEPYADDASPSSHAQARRAQSPESWPLGSFETRDSLGNTGAEGYNGIAAGSPSPSTRNQPSLLERTMDTLAQMPSSPAFNRKPSHFFDQSRSVSRAESGSSRPGSSHNPNGPGRSSSRQGSRPGSSGVQDPPTTPNFRASSTSFKNGLSSINGTPRGTSAIGQVKTPQTKTVPTNRLSLMPAAKLAAPGLLPVPDIAGSPSSGTERIGRASIKNGFKTVSGKPAKPRVSGQGLFRKPSLPAMKSLAGSTDGAHAPETGWDGCIPRASSLAATGAESPALKNRKSSAALREQIAQAKAAKRAAMKQTLVTQAVTVEDRQTVLHDESNNIVEHEDPFNLRKGEDPGSKVLQQRIATARTSGRLNIAALGLKAIPPEVMNMYSLESVGGQGGGWAESVDLTRLVGADNEIEQLGDEIFPDRSLDSFNDDNDNDGQGNIFGGLETLDLHGNVLSAVPLGFRRLAHLTSLNLSSNKLGNDSLATILQMTSLRDLKLSKNLLSGPLEAALLDLGALEILDLHGNSITALPPHMETMSRLRILNMNENQLEMIPFDSLSKLPMTELHVRKNRLTGVLIPKPVEGLAHLQTLDASANRLTHLVPEDGQISLPAVHSVSLSANRIQALPDIASWTSLLTLSLDENHIARIPESFTSLQKLRYADFSSNDISVVPPEIARMQGLTMIRLTGNPLRDRKLITATTDNLKEILAVRLEPPPLYQKPIDQSAFLPSRYHNGSQVERKLQAAAEIYPMTLQNDGAGSDAEEEDDDDFATPPTSAPHTPTRPRSDTVIKDVWFVKPGGLMDLSKSEMSSLDAQTCSAVAAQNQVRQIQLHHNPLAKIPISLTVFGSSLSILSLSHSHLAGESYLSELLELPALRELSIMSNQVTSLSPLTRFLQAPVLEKLDASLNRVTALPLDLKQTFPQLSVLLASSNQLTQLEPDSIRGLRIVDVSSNDIGQLNPRLGLLEGVNGLQRLDVTGNRFKVPRWSILEQGTGAILRWLRGRLPVEEMAAWRAANGGEVGGDLE